MANKLTDNDHFASKVALRVEAVTMLGEPRPVRVLDAYHGHGALWDAVTDALPEGWEVRLFRADKERRKAGTLRVNNARLLESLDLTKFDLFDLHAYGWPVHQLKQVATKAPDKLVVTTRIQMGLGALPVEMLVDLGLDIQSLRRSASARANQGSSSTATSWRLVMMSRYADELWEGWLYLMGYRTSRMLRYEHAGNGGRSTKRYELLIPDGWS